MNLAGVISNFLDELLGDNGVDWLQELTVSASDGGAAAMSRLQLRVAEAFLSDGWEPPDAELFALDHQWRRCQHKAAETDTATAADEDRTVLRGRVERALSMTHVHEDRAGEQCAALRAEVVQLRQAMKTRAVIEQAKGIL